MGGDHQPDEIFIRTHEVVLRSENGLQMVDFPYLFVFGGCIEMIASDTQHM